ncbi:hypothetical protein [Streptomyces sp. SID9727]|uniref:hypothetical protein n=1 Tax=Streptomyces sp. SID9727 TaxID=2706114 RepID=UPI0013C8E98E|nr:hypothetical protein [Streptomyces sp. SID9727]NEC68454.1 hypothetical protein [Streptomyces sp. SID9727]
MTLDQELAAATDVSAVFLDPARRRAELRADILAAALVGGSTAGTGTAGPTGDTLDPFAFQIRPTILRRVAALMAEELPVRTDRLVTADPVGTALTTAVALHTGLPFTLVAEAGAGDGPARLRGEIHSGEQIAVLDPVTTTGTRAARIARLVHARGARTAGVFTVIDGCRGAGAALAGAGHELHALFQADDGAVLATHVITGGEA